MKVFREESDMMVIILGMVVLTYYRFLQSLV